MGTVVNRVVEGVVEIVGSPVVIGAACGCWCPPGVSHSPNPAPCAWWR